MLHKSIEYNQTFIYDLDSNLYFPETFPNYYNKALPVLENIKKEFLRYLIRDGMNGPGMEHVKRLNLPHFMK